MKSYLNYSLESKIENNFENWLEAYSEFNSYSNFPMFIENTKIKMTNSYASENNVFKIKKTFNNQKKQEYINKFNFEDGYNLVKAIKKNIPENKGIILPPYIFNFRGTLKDHFVFFLEHPDGNFAMGNS